VALRTAGTALLGVTGHQDYVALHETFSPEEFLCSGISQHKNFPSLQRCFQIWAIFSYDIHGATDLINISQ
jgi:hypothetical protein